MSVTPGPGSDWVRCYCWRYIQESHWALLGMGDESEPVWLIAPGKACGGPKFTSCPPQEPPGSQHLPENLFYSPQKKNTRLGKLGRVRNRIFPQDLGSLVAWLCGRVWSAQMSTRLLASITCSLSAVRCGDWAQGRSRELGSLKAIY